MNKPKPYNYTPTKYDECPYCHEKQEHEKLIYMGGWADMWYHQSCYHQIFERLKELNVDYKRGVSEAFINGWMPTPPSKQEINKDI